MCRRSRDNAPARIALFQTKLAAQDAADNSAVWRQRACSLPAIPAPAWPAGLASIGTLAGAVVVVGSAGISGGTLHRSCEISIGFEHRRRGNQRATGSAMLLCRIIWFVVPAFADWRRHFAAGHGAARGEEQGGCCAGKFCGPYFRFWGSSAASRDWRDSGAGSAGSQKPKNIRDGERDCDFSDCDCRRRDCGASSAPTFFSHEAAIRSFARRISLNDEATSRDVAGVEHERDSSSNFYHPERYAGRRLRIAPSFPHMVVCVAIGETRGGGTNNSSRYRSAGSCACCVTRSVRRNRGAGGRVGVGLGCNFD